MLGHARFGRYLTEAGGDDASALDLYMWNTRISQAFYLPLQVWEVCLRNQMHRFLCKKHGAQWPFVDKQRLKLSYKDNERLEKAVHRQKEARGKDGVTTDAIVADLSAGFWVSMLSKSGNARYAWQNSMLMAFPKAPDEWRDRSKKVVVKWDHSVPHAQCDRLLNLRNRVAHHEPLFALDLESLHAELCVVVGAMCDTSLAYIQSHCAVQSVLTSRPIAANIHTAAQTSAPPPPPPLSS